MRPDPNNSRPTLAGIVLTDFRAKSTPTRPCDQTHAEQQQRRGFGDWSGEKCMINAVAILVGPDDLAGAIDTVSTGPSSARHVQRGVALAAPHESIKFAVGKVREVKNLRGFRTPASHDLCWRHRGIVRQSDRSTRFRPHQRGLLERRLPWRDHDIHTWD